jgi:large subunit ribosomal protein L32e
MEKGLFKMKMIELRNRMKKKKPAFIQQMGRQRKALGNNWKKPRGSDSKIKIGKKGYPRKVKVGFKSPKEVRGFSRDGLKIILVKNILELNNIDKTKETVCLASIGQRKKVDIVKKCVELNLKMLNVKDPSKFLKDVEENFKKKREDKIKKDQEKNKKKEDKKNKKKDGIEAVVSDEDKDLKDKEKKEKDKLLTKREK